MQSSLECALDRVILALEETVLVVEVIVYLCTGNVSRDSHAEEIAFYLGVCRALIVPVRNGTATTACTHRRVTHAERAKMDTIF